MRFDKLRHRLSSLEERHGIEGVQLQFADGSTRVVYIRDPLACLIATWNKLSATLAGRPAPASEHDDMVSLFSRAEKIEVDARNQIVYLFHEEARKLADPELAPGAPDLDD